MHALPYALLITFVFAAPCFAQRQIAVEISQAGTQPAATALAAELRREIRSQRHSSGGKPGATAQEQYIFIPTSELTRPHLRLQLLTVDVAAGGEAAVFVSVLYDSPGMPLGGAFVRSTGHTCSLDDIAACAKRILVQTHATVDWFRDRWPSLWNTL